MYALKEKKTEKWFAGADSEPRSSTDRTTISFSDKDVQAIEDGLENIYKMMRGEEPNTKELYRLIGILALIKQEQFRQSDTNYR